MTGRVVHVVRSDAFAGVERYICDVTAELSRRGWQVSAIGGDPPTMRAELAPAVEHRPARTVLGAARALLATGSCDVVHAHMTAAEAAATLTRGRTHARVVATRHFAGPRGGSAWVRPLAKAVEHRLDAEIAISRFVADACAGRPEVILNGVPDIGERCDPQQRVVLVMQRLEREKDTATAVRAWRAAGLGEQGWRLVVAGRGALAGDVRRLVADLGVDASVELRGFVPDPAAARAEASVFLATAPAEPFGLAVVEAMAAGMAVVAADGGAHRETVADAGVLFPPGDVEACASALREMATSADVRAGYGARARERQQRLLTVERHVDRLEEVYRRLFEPASTRA